MNISVGPTGEIFVVYSQSEIAAELFSNQNGQKSIATILSNECNLRSNGQNGPLQGSTNFEFFVLSRSEKVQLFDRDLKLLKEINCPDCRIGSVNSKLVAISHRNASTASTNPTNSTIKILGLPRLNSIQKIDLAGDVHSTEIFQLLSPSGNSTYLLATVSEPNQTGNNLIFFRLKKDGMIILQTISVGESISHTSLPINGGKELLIFLGSKASKNGKEFQILKFNGERVDHLFSQKFNFDIQSVVLYPGGKYALIISGLGSSRMGQLVEFDNSEGNLEILPQGFGFPLPAFAEGAFSSDGRWFVVGGGMPIDQRSGESNLILFQVEENGGEIALKEGSDILDQIADSEDLWDPSTLDSKLDEGEIDVEKFNLSNSISEELEAVVETEKKPLEIEKMKETDSSSFEQIQETALEVPSRKAVDRPNKEKKNLERKKPIDQPNKEKKNLERKKTSEQKKPVEQPNKEKKEQEKEGKKEQEKEGKKEQEKEGKKEDDTLGLRPRQEHERRKIVEQTSKKPLETEKKPLETEKKQRDEQSNKEKKTPERKKQKIQDQDESEKKRYYDLDQFQSNTASKPIRREHGKRDDERESSYRRSSNRRPLNEKRGELNERRPHEQKTYRETIEQSNKDSSRNVIEERARIGAERRPLNDREVNREERRAERRMRHEEAMRLQEKKLKFIAGKNIIEAHSDSEDFVR
jgi:hypothetical protein